MAPDLNPSTSPQHYFTAEPVGAEHLQTLDVTLAGHRVQVFTAGGIFSPDGVDKGTTILLKHAPLPPTHGTFLDLGCGWGPIALTLALHSPEAVIYAIDINRRAMDLARRNAETLGCSRVVVGEPAEIAGDLRFDLIWSNPAIRIGKLALHEMLLAWLPRLAPGGSAYLVVSKNLGADSLQTWIAGQDPRWEVQRYASDKGFRVLRVHLPISTPAA